MPKLTEANYTSRRIKLVASLNGAGTAHNDAAFRREIGDATDEDVKAARDAVSELEDRIAGLDTAWSRTQQEQAAAADERRAQNALASHGQIMDTLAKRTEMAGRMQSAAEELAAAYVEYQALGRHVIDAAVKHRELFNGDSVRHLRELIAGDFNDIRGPLARLLGISGLSMQGVNFNGFASDHILQRNVQAFNKWANRRVEGHVQALVGGI
jgi:uncharacterized small protein (DUF1192 family)